MRSAPTGSVLWLVPIPRPRKRASPSAAHDSSHAAQVPMTPIIEASVLRGFLLPLGIDFGFELAAADEFLQVADNGAAGHTELAGQG